MIYEYQKIIKPFLQKGEQVFVVIFLILMNSSYCIFVLSECRNERGDQACILHFVTPQQWSQYLDVIISHMTMETDSTS